MALSGREERVARLCTPGKADLCAAWDGKRKQTASCVSPERQGHTRHSHSCWLSLVSGLARRARRICKEQPHWTGHPFRMPAPGLAGASRRQQRGSPGQDLQGPGSTQPQHVLTALESHEHVPSPQATCVTGLDGPSRGWLRGRLLSSCRVGFGGRAPAQAGVPHTRAPLSPPALPQALPLPVLSKRGRIWSSSRPPLSVAPPVPKPETMGHPGPHTRWLPLLNPFPGPVSFTV